MIKKIIIGVVIVIILGISTIAIVATVNKNYMDSHEEIFEKLIKNYAKNKKTAYLAEIVAYINDVPVYMAEVVYYQELMKIQYKELILKGTPKNEFFQEQYFKNSQASIEETIYMIAISRAAILKGEELGYTYIDDEVKEIQEKNKQERDTRIELESEYGIETAINIYNEYKELYKKLNVTEEKFYETYDFLFQKSNLTKIKAITVFMDEYNKLELDPEEYWNSYLEAQKE
ncbi:MAG: hypothetical protein FWF15_05990 [Oscillospiraceae bacterium]|nr:hypothetical protein [Oscillospiraceae bacterium]